MRSATAAVPALLMLGAAGPLAAQGLFTDRVGTDFGWVELQHPVFDDGDLSAWLANAGLRVRVTRLVSLVGAVAVGRVGVEASPPARPDAEAATRIGNPYAGLRFDARTGPAWVELGAYLPTFKGEDRGDGLVALANLYGDYDRAEAFLSEAVAARLLVGTTLRSPRGTLLTLRGGPAMWFPTGERGSEIQVLIDYQAAVGVDVSRLTVQVGFTGRLNAKSQSAVGQSFGERTVHQAAAALGYRFAGAHPMLWVRLPLDQDLTEVLSMVLGLGVTFQLR